MNAKLKKVNSFWDYYFFLQTHSLSLVSFPFVFISAGLDYYSQGHEIVGLYLAEELIGVLTINRTYSRIAYLCLKPAYRRQGFGRLLVEFSRCDTALATKRSYPFWLRLGYTRTLAKAPLGVRLLMRVERKKGRWLKENVRVGTNQHRGSSLSTPTLKDIGISRDESSKAQRIAEYRLRVERKKGGWLKENVRVGNPKLSSLSTIGLKDIGISRDESSKEIKPLPLANN